MTRLHPRGQVMPFWAMVSSAMFALTFLIANYGNVVSWQVRAQTAADSAAAATLSADANVENQVSILLYLAALEEYRIRTYISYENTFNAEDNGTSRATGHGPGPCRGNRCPAYSDRVYNNLNLATTRLYNIIGQLRQMQRTISPGGYHETSGLLAACSMAPEFITAATAPQPALVTQQSPIDLANFTYSVKPLSGCPGNVVEPAQAPAVGQADTQATAETIDVVACSKTIPPVFSFPFFHGVVTAGRSVATLIKNTEYVEPGTLGACNMEPADCSNGLGVFFASGNPLQPAEYPGEFDVWNPIQIGTSTVNPQGPNRGPDPFVVDFGNFHATISWYTVGWIKPTSAAGSCPGPTS